ncbi:uncharacterized protein LOC122529164 [Frieseomelitta varia]|uniref:uncharacterized protein LOC122529164 n=1 Tax=Frieseomelitta varia TaxID=561572 RepID=UPI001CB69154|nr:uncharacterized protein LOC122529164 [Frieseomelitta varia]
MKILATHIPAIFLVIGFCSSNVAVEANGDQADNDTVSKRSESTGEEQSDLPILPPIILLDFGNNTEDENVTSEEKSKRTVNGGLGYGLDGNTVQIPRKYNYYFPAGKSGTTVSIEESISPFLPKTIIERVLPGNQKGHFADINGPGQTDPRHLNFDQSARSQPVFGLRTRPQKTVGSSSSESYQNFFATAKPPASSFAIQNPGYRSNNFPTTTQSPLAASVTETLRYVTPTPANFANPQSGSLNYVTADPFPHNGNGETHTSQRQNIQSNINSHRFGSVSQSVESTTATPLNYDPPHFRSAGSPLSNTSPRYTVENGIRYENKIFWKYPDGRVSDVPPATYVEYQRPSSTQQHAKSQDPRPIYEGSSTENGVLSQGPLQFPTVSEQTGGEANTFVSAESFSASLPQQQVYRLGYQNLVNQRQHVNLQQRQPTSYSFASVSSERGKPSPIGSNVNYGSRYRQTSSRYMVNSPNPEYTTEPTINSTASLNSISTSSTVRPSSRTKYDPKIRDYLDTILGENGESAKQSFSGNSDLNSYSNLQYSDLLNYNPSISEYVRNPSSILNVRPTFVQAGNSLIPVIILRVDGASPIQTKDTQNVNLKALLQQYLIQYAKSIQQLAQPSTYNLGTESFPRRSATGSDKSPILDLIRLAEGDEREPPSYHSNSYVGKSSYETSNVGDSQDFTSSRYVERSTGRQKTKSVQILDNPKYSTAYKVNK